MRLNTNQRRGSALVLCLVLVTMIAGLGAGLVQVSAAHQRKQNKSINNMRALYIAEAGLAEAYLIMKQGRSGEIGNQNELAAFAGGYFWVTAEGQADGMVLLQSTGLYRSGRFSLGAVVSSSFNPVGANGVSSMGNLHIGPNSSFDVLDPNGLGTMAQLRSDGDIIFEGSQRGGAGSTVVLGNVQPGPMGIVEGGSYVEISGSTSSSLTAMDLPPVRFPDLGPSSGNVKVRRGTKTTLTGDQRIDLVMIAPDATLIIAGPAVIHADRLSVEQRGSITIDTSAGSVEIYLNDSIDLARGSFINDLGGDPSQTAILVGSPDPDQDGNYALSTQSMDASGTFFGVIYTPYSALTIGGSMDIVGAVSAGDLTLEVGANVTYDPGLASGGVGVEPEVKLISWMVLGLPDEPIVRTQLNPKVAMPLLGVTASASSKASKMRRVKIRLETLSGVERTYTGELKDLDWSNVKKTKAIKWWIEKDGAYSKWVKYKLFTDPDGRFDLDVDAEDGGFFSRD